MWRYSNYVSLVAGVSPALRHSALSLQKVVPAAPACCPAHSHQRIPPQGSGCTGPTLLSLQKRYGLGLWKVLDIRKLKMYISDYVRIQNFSLFKGSIKRVTKQFNRMRGDSHSVYYIFIIYERTLTNQ